MTATALPHRHRRGARLGAAPGVPLAWLMAIIVAVSAGLLPQPGHAQPAAGAAPPVSTAVVPRAGAQRVDAVEAELVADVSRAAPGQPFRIGLRLAHDPHWHTYWRNPGDSGLPTRFEPTGPDGTNFGDITWPAPRRMAIGDLANYGYEDELVLAREVVLPASFDAASARFTVLAQWLVCKDVCIPGEAALALDLPVGPAARSAEPAVVKLFDASERNAPQPGDRLEAGWWQQGTQALLLLPQDTAASHAEFFPSVEGGVRPAAPQSLVVAQLSPDAPQRRLALRLETVAGGAGDEGSLPQAAAGVLLLDGKAVEAGLQPLATAPEAGQVLAVAAVVPAAPAPARSLLDRLIGGKGGAATGAAAGSARSASTATGTGGRTDAAGAVAPGARPAATAASRPFPSSAGGGASGTLWIALAGALLGGLILNLMPCVFPVIGLKVLSFSQAAAGSPRLARRHALAFSGGVVLSFLALGLVMLALRQAGEAAGWGFQMQSPVFVGAMALLFVLIGLNLFGVFETGVLLTRLGLPSGGTGPVVGQDGGAGAVRAVPGGAATAGSFGNDVGNGVGNSFGTGVIAVLVATPCTAPFMGSAVGYTLASPPLQTLLIFAALGAGMALPYLVLGWAPRLLRVLPRPGPWLLVFKQLLAFPMLATAAWLAWVLTLQAGADGLLHLLMSAILLAFGAWIYGRAQQAAMGGRARPGVAGLAAAALAGALTVWQLVQIGSDAAALADAYPSASFAAAAGPVNTVGGGARAPGPSAPGLQGQSNDLSARAATSAAVDLEAGNSASPGSAGSSGIPGGADGAAHWQPWSVQKVSQSLARGRPVLVDFTAAWCISCQANKKLVLEREVVRRAFEAQEVTLLRADWTRRDPAITAELASFGRNGVPLYLVYHVAGEPPLMLPELLTVDIVLAALANGR